MNKLILAIDFDGTLCIDNLFPTIGEPRTWLIERAIQWRKDGHKLILWTCREDVSEDEYCPMFAPGNYLSDAIEWCRGFGLEFDAVNKNLMELKDPAAKMSRKIFAHYYIDDKAICFADKDKCMYGMDSLIYRF